MRVRLSQRLVFHISVFHVMMMLIITKVHPFSQQRAQPMIHKFIFNLHQHHNQRHVHFRNFVTSTAWMLPSGPAERRKGPCSFSAATTRTSFTTIRQHTRPSDLIARNSRRISRLYSSNINNKQADSLGRKNQQQLVVDKTNVDELPQQPQEEEVWQDEDTIYALSTGNIGAQATAVAVIRISGPQAHHMLEQLLLGPSTNNTSKEDDDSSPRSQQQRLPPPRKAVVRTLYDPVSHAPLDQALVLRFDAPHSFTGEDVVELHCHGSRAVLQGILESLSQLLLTSSRLAEPGEFTQRAMYHGKLDLLQVEALADLLAADTQRQRKQALQQLQPGDHQLSRLYSSWRSTLISGLAHAEAVIDFGDDEHLDQDDGYDLDLNSNKGQWNVWGHVATNMHQLWLDMQQHLADGRRGELVRTGIKVAIVGPPNAGKSSLFNLLAQREAAIVSPQAGTTRDVLELTLDLGGVKCLLSDTAGLRETTTDLIEQEGMKRARNVAQQADIVLAVVDMTNPNAGLQALEDTLQQPSAMESHDEEIDDDDDDNNDQVTLLVLNKLDLTQSCTEGNLEAWRSKFSFAETCAISCETNDGVDSFLEALTKLVVRRVSGDGDADPKTPGSTLPREGAMITRARHRQHVVAAAEALHRFSKLSQQGSMAVDLAAEELRLAASELGRITGAVDVEDVLDVLFRDFCIGK